MAFSIQTKDAFDRWEEDTMHELEKDFMWIKNIYWKLDEVSCVLVMRNKKWFQDTIGKIEETWGIIEKERISGFQHRAAAKRAKKPVEYLSNTIDGCFLKILKNNSESSKITNNLPDKKCLLHVLKIRTESFDETKKNM